jgi:hypothetical protein
MKFKNNKKSVMKYLFVIGFSFGLSACGGDSSDKNIGSVNPPVVYDLMQSAADIILDSDPSSFVGLNYIGQDIRTLYDWRIQENVELNAYIFIAAFDDGVEIEIQVNPEFDQASASNYAEYYSNVIGQLPYTLRKGVKYVGIHKGYGLFNGDKGRFDVHIGTGNSYITDGILAEVIIHEAAHAGLEEAHINTAKWKQAQQQDNVFISYYANKNPDTEDLAETVVAYLAVRFKSDRISEEIYQKISTGIDHRINYLDALNFEIYPMVMSSR